MKKKPLIIGAILVAVALAVVAVCLLWPKKFDLSADYVGESGFVDIDVDELGKLIDEKKSFAVFLYQPDCRTSENFEIVLTEFMTAENVRILKTDYVEAKHSGLVPGLKYYPSLALYHDGALVDFLKADEDGDIPYYETEAGFREWWEKYIK